MRFSLKIRMALTVCLLLLAVLSLAGFAFLKFFAREYQSAIARQQFALVSEMADDIDQELARGQGLIVRTAATFPLAALDDPDRIQDFLDQRLGLGTQEYFDNGIFVFSPQGQLLAEWPFKPDRRGRDYSFRDYFRKTVETGKPYISEPYQSSQPHQHPAVNFTAPLFDPAGKLAGVFCGSIDLTKNNFLGGLGKFKIGQTGYLYLYSTDRLMIMHPDPSRILKRDVPPGANLLFDRAIEGFEGTEETVNSRGVRMLASFKRLAAINWILAANYPAEEAFAPVNRAQQVVILGLAGTLAAVALLVWVAMRQLTRPLQQFTGHLRELAHPEGNRAPLPIRRDDEIGVLTDAFNRLMAEVEEQKALSRERLDFLQTIIDSIPVPVYYKDVKGAYLGCNTAFELALGLTRAEVLGKCLADIIPPEETEAHLRTDAELLNNSGDIVRSYEQALTFGDGTRHDAVFFKAGFRDGGGSPAGLVGTIIDISERKVMEAALAQQREFSENLLQNSTVPCFVIDSAHLVLFWNRACEELTGVPAAAVLGTRRPWTAFYPEARPCLADLVIDGEIEKMLDLYERFGDSPLIPAGVQAAGWFPQVGGKARYLQFDAAPIHDHQGKLIAAIETLQDLTTLKQAERALRESEESHRSLIDRSPDAILVHREGEVIFVNEAAALLFGAQQASELEGIQVLNLVHPEDHALVAENGAETAVEQPTTPYREGRVLRRDGEAIDVEASSTSVSFGGKWAIQTILRDIRERKELQERVWRQANFDALTGIPNRMLFHDRLQQALARAAREGYEVALLFIDLDEFKEINDTFGHEAGDQLLREAAGRLSEAIRRSDTLARMGGDEFTVIMPCVVEPPMVSIVAARILETLARPFFLPGGGEGRISGSLGVALFPRDAKDPAALLKHADAAMYRAKQGGRNAYCFYGQPSLNLSPGPPA